MASTSAMSLCNVGLALPARRITQARASQAPARVSFTGIPALGRSRVAQQSRLVTRATTEEKTEVDVEAIVKDLQEKWDGVENKTSFVVYAGGALVLVWFSSTIVSAVNAVPLLPKLLELVGLGYTAWFVYRYLLFKSSREELIQDVDELKKKITGAAEDAGWKGESKTGEEDFLMKKPAASDISDVRSAVEEAKTPASVGRNVGIKDL